MSAGPLAGQSAIVTDAAVGVGRVLSRVLGSGATGCSIPEIRDDVAASALALSGAGTVIAHRADVRVVDDVRRVGARGER